MEHDAAPFEQHEPRFFFGRESSGGLGCEPAAAARGPGIRHRGDWCWGQRDDGGWGRGWG